MGQISLFLFLTPKGIPFRDSASFEPLSVKIHPVVCPRRCSEKKPHEHHFLCILRLIAIFNINFYSVVKQVRSRVSRAFIAQSVNIWRQFTQKSSLVLTHNPPVNVICIVIYTIFISLSRVHHAIRTIWKSNFENIHGMVHTLLCRVIFIDLPHFPQLGYLSRGLRPFDSRTKLHQPNEPHDRRTSAKLMKGDITSAPY